MSVTKHVDLNTIFDSSTSFLRNTTFDSSIYINVASPEATGDNPYAVITLGTGTNQLIRYRQLGSIAWDEASIYSTKAINDAQDASILDALSNHALAWNGLTKTVDGSIGIGGSLEQPSTITTDATNTLIFAGLQTSASDTPLALVQDSTGTAIKTRALGSMAWETATDYGLASYNTIQDISIAQLDASILRIDNYNYNVQDVSIALSAALNIVQDNSIAQLDASIIRIDNYNYNVQDVSIAALAASAGDYVLKAGDDMTGQLTITGGGLEVGSIGTPQDVSIYSDLYVHNDLTIGGNLSVDGSLYIRSVETIDVSSSFIHLNTGATGVPDSGMQSGIIIDRGSSDPYVFIFDESTQDFRIGISAETSTGYLDASTQAVATREDTPLDTGVAYWNNTENRFDTDASLIFNEGLLTTGNLTVADGVVVISGIAADAGEFTGILINGSDELVSKEFGTGAFATIGDYTLTTTVDADNAAQDASIIINQNAIAALDSSVAGHEISITDLSTGKLDAVASTTGVSGHEVYSTEADNIAYIKRLFAGTGIIISSDASVITVSTNNTTVVTKYATTLDGTSGNSLTVLQSTHGIPAPGPYHVSLYDNLVMVMPGVEYNSSGDVTITWSSGSLTADCSLFITG
jgi:hypothetical protein